jgi:hypothetical protein
MTGADGWGTAPLWGLWSASLPLSMVSNFQSLSSREELTLETGSLQVLLWVQFLHLQLTEMRTSCMRFKWPSSFNVLGFSAGIFCLKYV